MSSVACAGGCGRTYEMSAFQAEAVKSGAFESWTCSACVGKPRIVPKPWGYEYCAFDNGNCAVWILHIARGRKTSRHCHPNKRTRLICLQGEVHVNKRWVKPLEVVDIDRGEYHQSEVHAPAVPASENGAFVMEIEEPSNKGDIVRADDAYGRAGKPIENYEVPCGTPMLQLSTKAQSIMGYTFKIESTLGGGQPPADLMLEAGGEIIGIYREKKRRLADCVADFVKSLGIEHVFGVTGGGSMHLNDAFREVFIANHHEQASAFAADAYARVRGIGCALVTTGPGGTNAITGVSASWIDSIPVIFLSGQVTRNTLLDGHGLRQFGVQESDITTLVQSITKYAIVVRDEKRIRYELEKAAHLACSGRPGPVWIDIPLDVQSKMIDWDTLERYEPTRPREPQKYMLALPAERPVLVIGNGVHIAQAEEACRRLVRDWNIPVVSSWLAADIVPTDDPLYIGRFGIFGDRAANFTVQNADLLIVLGSRLSIPQVGHNFKTFARGARIVMVDIDRREMEKPSLHVEHKIVCDVAEFIRNCANPKYECYEWTRQCQHWKREYPVDTSSGSFKFVKELCDALPEDAVVVTDMGTAFTCTFQTARIKRGQRWITSAGHAPMGYGLPAAIGAHYATGKRITCLVGDGGLMFNLQELQTIGERKLPIDIYVIDNGGYLAMRHTQMNHFGRIVGADFKFPGWVELGAQFGVYITRVVHMDAMQPLIPRSSSMKLPDGSIASRPIEDLYPFLPREEFRAQMIVPPMEVYE